MSETRALLFLLLATMIPACGGTPTDTTRKIIVKRPITDSLQLWTISGTSANDVWFAGQSTDVSPIVHWDGHTFSSVPEAGLDRVEKIWAIAPNDVYAVGAIFADNRVSNETRARVVHYDGTSWQIVFTDTVDSSAGSIVATGPDDVWFGGAHVLMGSNPDGAMFAPRLIHWDGSNWTVQDVPSSQVLSINEVWAGGPDDVWIRGGDDNVAHFDGTAWHDQTVPQGLTQGFLRTTYFGVQIAPREYYFLVNHVVARWDGMAMDSTNVAEEISNQPAMSGTGETNLWFAGRYCTREASNPAFPCEEYTRSILHWDGHGWTRYLGDGEISVTPTPFVSVWTKTVGDVWAVDGADDAIYHLE